MLRSTHSRTTSSHIWGGGAESQSVLINGDASMAIVWSTRAIAMEQDSGGQIKFIWDQGLLSPGALGVIKNNPGGKDSGDEVHRQRPGSEETVGDVRDAGPGSRQSRGRRAHSTRQAKVSICVSPSAIKKQIVLDMPWYSEHYTAALDAYTALISA